MLTYIIVTFLNILGMVGIFFLFYPTKPLGRLFESNNKLKSFCGGLIFALLYTLFALRCIYFLCLIILEV